MNKDEFEKGLKEIEEEMEKSYLENHETFIRELYGLSEEDKGEQDE